MEYLVRKMGGRREVEGRWMDGEWMGKEDGQGGLCEFFPVFFG
jgi:hypothetical protein